MPGKNIKSFDGKPMIARSIETALESGVFDAAVVSTVTVRQTRRAGRA